jgi:hypothetical protein
MVEGAEKRKDFRVRVLHENQDMPVARSRAPEREKEVVLRL